ncbi:MAG: hypothetical protein A3G75_13160 [Verrucomicrobia bacterium RIFCSPLOWO2_12_FULL_64_8]|nr:MAG: hypothetical protein A3G75_13160 [Verrucomicrobia bacterium RIFCSPLOWO2_12_FULL_64_8]
MKRFEDIYTERHQDAGWSVVQAATLLAEAQRRRCSSLVIYAALELRMAIEQLIFTIICVAKGSVDDPTVQECRKKDGLFRILDDVTPGYSKRCRFSNALASFYPGIPQVAEWDVRSLKRYYTALSDLCHSQLVILGMAATPEKWDKRISLLEEVYAFLAAGLKKGTGVLTFKGADSVALDLWEKYLNGTISLEDVQQRFALVKPVLDSRRIQT